DREGSGDARERRKRGGACERKLTGGGDAPQLLEDALGRKLPVLVRLGKEQVELLGIELVRRRRKCRAPALGARSGVELRERHDGELRVAERRVETLVDRIALPASFGALRAQAEVDGLREPRVRLRALARERQRVDRVKGDEVGRLRGCVEPVAPLAVLFLKGVELLDELRDLALVPLASHQN